MMIGCGSLIPGVPVTGLLLGLVIGLVGLNVGVVIAVGSNTTPGKQTPEATIDKVPRCMTLIAEATPSHLVTGIPILLGLFGLH
jgi:hypothetical protein